MCDSWCLKEEVGFQSEVFLRCFRFLLLSGEHLAGRTWRLTTTSCFCSGRRVYTKRDLRAAWSYSSRDSAPPPPAPPAPAGGEEQQQSPANLRSWPGLRLRSRAPAAASSGIKGIFEANQDAIQSLFFSSAAARGSKPSQPPRAGASELKSCLLQNVKSGLRAPDILFAL